MDVLLFTFDSEYGAAATHSGMAGIVVDWEWHGKSLRQAGADTEISRGTDEDLARMRAAVKGRVICRVNNKPGTRIAEARRAVDLGADEIWLPMVRGVAEVEECLAAISGRAELGVLVETREALELGPHLSKLPVTGVFIGLHDLRLELQGAGLFDPLLNGAVDSFRASYSGRLGVAGLTHPDAGHPVPQRLLLAEMSRLRCVFGIARRSFRANVPPERIAQTLTAISAEMERLAARDEVEIEHDRARLREAVAQVSSADAACAS